MRTHDIGYARFIADASRRKQDRDDYFSLLRRMIINFDAVGDRFFADSTVVGLPGVRIINSRSSGFRTERTRAMVQDSDDRALYMCLDGCVRITHGGRDITLHTGDTTLLSSSDPLIIERGESRQMVVAVPRNILIDSVANTDAALMRKMDRAAEPLRLLRNYIDAFTDNPGLVQPDYGGLLASQIQDLVAIAVGATRDAAEIAHGRGIKAGRMRAIKSDIARNLTSGDVSATTLAARHKISRRYIHMLFEHEGTTLSRFVMAQRLAHVERALSDPRQLHLTIGAIAYNAGFNDLSSFNHAFRRRHGVTPREFRANLRQGLRSR